MAPRNTTVVSAASTTAPRSRPATTRAFSRARRVTYSSGSSELPRVSSTFGATMRNSSPSISSSWRRRGDPLARTRLTSRGRGSRGRHSPAPPPSSHRTRRFPRGAPPPPPPPPRPRAPLPEERDEPFVQGNRYLGRRRVDEAGPPPLARVAVEGELRHHEQRPAYVGEGQVHLPLGVTEQPQTEHLVRHPGELVLGVGWGKAREDEKPRPNFPGYAPGNAHFRTRDPLQHDPHRPAPTRTRNGERGTRNIRGAFVEQDLPLLFRVPSSAFRVRLTRPSRFSPGSAAGPRCTPVAPRCSTRAAGAAAP